MKAEEKDNQLDQLIHEAIGRDDVPFDFQRWKQRHQSSIEESLRQRPNLPLVQTIWEYVALHRRSAIRLAGLAAIVLFALVSLNPFSGPRGGVAFGQVLENMTRVQTFHARVDHDGKEGEIWAKRPNMLRIEDNGETMDISNGPTMWSVNIPFNKATKKPSHFFNDAQKQGLDVIDYFVQVQCMEGFQGFFSEGPVDRVTSEGRRLDVYRMRFSDHGADMSFEALVDGETHLIHSLTVEHHSEGELVGEFRLSGIEYNGPVADELFSFQPPEKMRVIVEEPKETPDLASTQTASSAQGATLSGVVTWVSSGKPVSGARLSFKGGGQERTPDGRFKSKFFVTTETDRQGAWRVTGAPAGRIDIGIHSWEFDWPAVPTFTTNIGSLDNPIVDVDGHSEYAGLNFKVYKPDDYYARITISVTDEDGRPIRGVSASLQDSETADSLHGQQTLYSTGHRQLTQDDGKFDARDIWPMIRPVKLHVQPRDQNEPYAYRGVYTDAFTVESQKKYHFDVVLPYKREMTVRVVGLGGQPLEGVAVSVLDTESSSPVYPLSGPRGKPLLTDLNGRADVSNMNPGEEVFIALRRLDPNDQDQWNPLASAFVPATAPLDRSKPRIEAVFDEHPITVEGRLRVDSPILAVRVFVYIKGELGDRQHVPVLMVRKVDGEGRFVLHGVPAGIVRLFYSATGPDKTSRRGEGIMTVERGNRYRIEFTEQGLQILSREPIP